MDWPRCGWLGLSWGWGGPVARTGAAVRDLCVGAGRIWTWCGVMPRGCGADGLRADAAAVLDAELRVCVGGGGAAEDFSLERAEALQAVGEALQDERGVGGAEGARQVGEVRGFGALAERRSDAFGPGDEQPNDEEQEEGGRRRAAGLGPGGGSR